MKHRPDARQVIIKLPLNQDSFSLGDKLKNKRQIHVHSDKMERTNNRNAPALVHVKDVKICWQSFLIFSHQMVYL